MRIVSPDEARRIAVPAQWLDGSATGVLDTRPWAAALRARRPPA